MFGSRLTGPLIVLLSAGVLLAQPVAADILEEVHQVILRTEDPTPGTTYQGNFDVPFFDTAGGTRTLIGFRMDYNLYDDHTVSINENPTPDWHGCYVEWATHWVATRNGEKWLPVAGNDLGLTRGIGVVLGPYHEAIPPTSDNGNGIEGYQTTGDAAFLGGLIGTGTFAVDYTHSLSELTYSAPPPRAWPPSAPPSQRVFDPDMIDLTIDAIGLDLTVTYYWTPEPSSLGLLLLGTVLQLRRR